MKLNNSIYIFGFIVLILFISLILIDFEKIIKLSTILNIVTSIFIMAYILLELSANSMIMNSI